jgi:hypothetical protein
MSEFGGRTDIQQIRIIALVMITVLPEPRPEPVIPGPDSGGQSSTQTGSAADMIVCLVSCFQMFMPDYKTSDVNQSSFPVRSDNR